MAKAKEFREFDPAAMDALIWKTKTPEDLLAHFRFMQTRIAERILAGELTGQLGYGPGEADQLSDSAGYEHDTHTFVRRTARRPLARSLAAPHRRGSPRRRPSPLPLTRRLQQP